MKGRHGGIILFFIFIIKEISGRQLANLNTDLLDHLGSIGSSHSNPLIVYVNTAKKQSIGLESDFDDVFSTGNDGDIGDDSVYEDEAKEHAKYLLYNYLLRTSPEDGEDSSAEETRLALRQALRKRCEAVVKCTSKCPPKEKKYCPVNCKAVFDKLNLCEPPKEKKNKCKEESNECGKRGKTMPPKW